MKGWSIMGLARNRLDGKTEPIRENFKNLNTKDILQCMMPRRPLLRPLQPRNAYLLICTLPGHVLARFLRPPAL